MTTIIIGKHSQFYLQTEGSDGANRPASFSAHVSDYSKGYVSFTDGNASNNIGVVVNGKAIGTFDVTFAGHSQDGTALAPLTRSYTVEPVPVPQADHFVVSDDAVSDNTFLTPADPGTDTVTGTL